MTDGPDPHIETAYLADGVAGNPAGALLFLLAARDPGVVYTPIDLGDALARAEQRPEGDTIYKALRAKSGCLALLGTGYLAPGYDPNGQRPPFHLKGDGPVRASPHMLPYKRMVATDWLDAELRLPPNIPEKRIVDIVGQNRHMNKGLPGVPSLSLALYEAILASGDGTANLRRLIGGRPKGDILRDPRIDTRIRQLRKSGAIQEAAYSRLGIRPELAPFISSLLFRMRLLAEHAADPTYQQMAEERAEAILTSPVDIRRLLAKTQQTPENKRPQPPQLPRFPKPTKPQRTPADHLPMQIQPGTYAPDWILRGLCTIRDVDARRLTINPNDSQRTAAGKIKEAGTLCPECAVSSPCARSAIKADDQTAIAGHTPAQRAALTPAQRQEYLDMVIITPYPEHRKG